MDYRPKHIFELDGDGSAAVSDTGLFPAFGSIRQVRWVPDTQDTGPGNIGSLALFSKTTKEQDTGLSQLVWSESSLALGNDVVRLPRQPAHNSAGVNLDTGGDNYEPVYTAGEVLVARFTPGDTGLVAGELHVWMG